MGFANWSLLAGGLLIGIPIALHLLMRTKPKHVLFPALRFIKERRQTNSRQLQLRHLILLALRCAAVAVPAIALARPSVASAMISSWVSVGLVGMAVLVTAVLAAVAYTRDVPRAVTYGFGGVSAVMFAALVYFLLQAMSGPGASIGNQEAPVAAVLVIDTSPRMAYRHENRTRLEATAELADWLITQFPADSEVAAVSGRGSSAAFAVDRSSAIQSIQRLETIGTSRPLPELIATGLHLLKESPKERKEMYVFTDLAAAAWQGAAGADLARQLAEQADVQLYLIDVGIEQPVNAGLGNLELSTQLLSPSAELQLRVPIFAEGIQGDREIELVLEDPDPRFPVIKDGQTEFAPATRRGSQTVKFGDERPSPLEFHIRGLNPGLHQGHVRLIGGDALAVDDIRYFAIDVQPAWPVLIVIGPNVDGGYLFEAIAPRQFRQTNQARFAPEMVTQQELTSKNLSGYRAVALLDPGPMPEEVWQTLSTYVEDGGGLAMFLGHNADQKSFAEPTVAKLLGGKLTRQTRTKGDVYVAPASYDHPVLQPFRQIEANVPWDRFPIYYHWNLDSLQPSARIVAAYGNNKPALVENLDVAGRVLTLTTPISDPLRPKGRGTWNELATGEDAWPCFVLVNEMMLHLAQSGAVTRLNFRCGETAVLANDGYAERYQLFTPNELPQDMTARDGKVVVRFTDHPGNYRMKGLQGGAIIRGFAVNLPAEQTDLTRIARDSLDPILGKDRYRLARNRDDIDREVVSARVGSEFYPLLMAFVALVLGLEHVLANRFDKGRDQE